MAPSKDDAVVSASCLSKERLGSIVGRRLAVQGFCAVDGLVGDGELARALEDVAALDQDGHLQQPAAMLVDGLLGTQGSARICDLWSPEKEDCEWIGGEHISQLDAEMTAIGEALAPYVLEAGVEVRARTGGVVHEAGTPVDEGPNITGEACSKWINIFANHRLMFVWCLGPGRGGVLELQPFDGDCNGAEIDVTPGMLVILRADIMQHRFTSAGQVYCLTCFFQKDSMQRKQRVEQADDEVTPCCQALEAWAYERMREYKESFPEEQTQLDLPRSWELLASHTNFVGQHISVRTASVRQPSTWDPLAWASAFQVGPDYILEVPLLRWDHGQVFAPDETKGGDGPKTSCQHGGFIDGIEMFDNTIFRLSRMEASGMDPGCRLTLETGYEALVRDGYKTKTLMGSRGGVYVANPPPSEWAEAEKSTAGGVCGGGGSIACGRFSFTHGIKGPCISIDVEAASSLVAVNLASANLSRIGNWEAIPFALLTSFSLQLNPRPYIYGSARGLFSPQGRTFALDGSATGYVRSDVAISLVLKALTDVVDGDMVVQSEDFLGVLAGSATNQSGRRAHITAPDAVALQEVVVDCLRQADISPLDVDACDVFADGMIMNDAVEVSATARGYRPDGIKNLDSAPPLALLASKTPLGNQLEACGLSSILKVVLAAQFGMLPPNVHSRILNPYIDLDLCERSAQAPNELLEYNMESSYTGIANRSCVGTNCHVIAWGHVTREQTEPAPEGMESRSKLLFWPEGGGDLDENQLPKRGYSIIGTWNNWEPQQMQQEGAGTWTFIATLGINRWERFQIALDGTKDRVLHPEHAGAAKGALVCGPAAVLQSESWLLDGRVASDFEDTSHEDFGRPGDKYRIRFRVKGKWRMLDWEKLPDDERGAADFGDYYVVGTWNNLLPEVMARRQDEEGMYYLEVHLANDDDYYFQVVRNKDWSQVICPVEPFASNPSREMPVAGPDENWGHSWLLQAKRGDVVRIELQRVVSEDRDNISVTWTKLRTEEPSRAMILKASATQVFVAGTWDGFRHPVRMNWAGQYFQAYLQLGASAKASFQIYKNADPKQCMYPSEHNAAPGDGSTVLGPDGSRGAGRCWTLGLESRDEAAPGKRYEIRLHVDPTGARASSLEWVGPLSTAAGLEEAKGRGYLIFCE